ncbi:hypothetical protein [uncultured Dysosmobacter sp.]|uniref:hypothetical protein n=1 Tax=uncultured Dysosmobacter sp. TaxID=2591384 RepID=UPI00260E49FA|nr:hypothetical protein [uncultured Dysosmobacter sp.]
MKQIYEKLFDHYGIEILGEAKNYDETAIQALLETFPLSQDARWTLSDAFSDFYFQWSADAFAVGLHLGLSLLHDDIRRIRPQ